MNKRIHRRSTCTQYILFIYIVWIICNNFPIFLMKNMGHTLADIENYSDIPLKWIEWHFEIQRLLTRLGVSGEARSAAAPQQWRPMSSGQIGGCNARVCLLFRPKERRLGKTAGLSGISRYAARPAGPSVIAPRGGPRRSYFALARARSRSRCARKAPSRWRGSG